MPVALNGLISDISSASLSSALFTVGFFRSLFKNDGGLALASFFCAMTLFGVISFLTTVRGLASCSSLSLRDLLLLCVGFGLGILDCLATATNDRRRDKVLGLTPTTCLVSLRLGTALAILDSGCDADVDADATMLDVDDDATRATRCFSTAEGFGFLTAAVVLFGESAVLVIVDNFVRLVAGLTLDEGVLGAVVFLLFGLAL